MATIVSRKEKDIWNEIDEITKGAYISPQKVNFRMNEMRKYCKSVDKKYSELTEQEKNQFMLDKVAEQW